MEKRRMWKLEETIQLRTGEEIDETLEATNEAEIWQMLLDRQMEVREMDYKSACWEMFHPDRSSGFAVFYMAPGSDVKVSVSFPGQREG